VLVYAQVQSLTVRLAKKYRSLVVCTVVVGLLVLYCSKEVVITRTRLYVIKHLIDAGRDDAMSQ
jgi:hypothetical protein